MEKDVRIEEFEKTFQEEARRHAEEIDFDRLLEDKELTDKLFKKVFGRGRRASEVIGRFVDDIGNKYLKPEERTYEFKKRLLLAAVRDPAFKKRILREIVYRAGLLKSLQVTARNAFVSETKIKIKDFLREKTGLIIAALAVIGVLLAPAPAPFEFGGKMIELTRSGQQMIALLAGMVIIFVTEALPLGSIVGLVYAWIIFFGILPEKGAAAIFSHDAAWFLIGALMIANVLVKYGIHKRVLLGIMKVVGSKTKYISLGIISFCAVCAAFISEHTVAALLLPVALAIIQVSGGFNKSPGLSKLILFSIAFGCCIGGLGTPSGGGRNVLMIGFLEDIYGVRISYRAWMAMAMPITLLLIPCLWTILLKIFKPEIPDLKESIFFIKKEMRTSRMGIKEWMVVAIFLGILGLWLSRSHLGIGMISLFGAVLFIVFGLVEWKDYQNINWGIAMLYFGAIGMGKCLQITGAATWLAGKALVSIGRIIPVQGKMIVAGISSAIITLSTNTMADGPCVATIGPVLLEVAKLTAVDPVFLGVIISCSAAFAFMLIVGTPANAIVYGSGYLRAKDFIKAGACMTIVGMIVLLSVAYFWWGFLNVGINGFH
jgi:sodium-dependent dicarboxylate transporter 2/3/5